MDRIEELQEQAISLICSMTDDELKAGITLFYLMISEEQTQAD